MGISSKAFGKKLPLAFGGVWSCRKTHYFLVLILMKDGSVVVWLVHTLLVLLVRGYQHTRCTIDVSYWGNTVASK